MVKYHLIIIRDLSSRKRVKLATVRSLCGSIVLKFLRVRPCRQHLWRFMIIFPNHHYHNLYCLYHNRHYHDHCDNHRTCGNLSGSSVILKSLSTSLNVAAVELNLWVSHPIIMMTLPWSTHAVAPQCRGLHRRQTGASRSMGWRWGWSKPTSPGRPPHRLARIVPPPPIVFG